MDIIIYWLVVASTSVLIQLMYELVIWYFQGYIKWSASWYIKNALRELRPDLDIYLKAQTAQVVL